MKSALLLVVLLSGCFHTTLPPISPNAGADERVAAYQRLRPIGVDQNITVYASRYGASVSVTDSLVLADGTSVRHADDLLPALDPQTPAANAARRSAEARHQKITWGVGGLLVAVASGIVFLARASDRDIVEQGFDGGDFAALTLMTAAPLVGGIGALYFGHVEASERRAAFWTYDPSLRQSLHLCVDGMQITDCAARVDAPRTAALPTY